VHRPSLPFSFPITFPASSSSPSWLSSADIDPDYTPQKRHRTASKARIHAKLILTLTPLYVYQTIELSIFVRFEKQPTYRAVYLEELTVLHLKEKLVSKLLLEGDQEVKELVRQVSSKQDLLVCIDDDAIVQDIPEEQDILVHKQNNDDGSLTLVLIY
jgi:hypothetical protein